MAISFSFVAAVIVAAACFAHIGDASSDTPEIFVNTDGMIFRVDDGQSIKYQIGSEQTDLTEIPGAMRDYTQATLETLRLGFGMGYNQKQCADNAESCPDTTNFVKDTDLELAKTTLTNLINQKASTAEAAMKSNVYDRSTIDSMLVGKADASAVYTQGEIEAKINSAINSKIDASDVYNKDKIDELLANLPDGGIDTTQVSSLIADAMKDVYTKEEVDMLLSNINLSFQEEFDKVTKNLTETISLLQEAIFRPECQNTLKYVSFDGHDATENFEFGGVRVSRRSEGLYDIDFDEAMPGTGIYAIAGLSNYWGTGGTKFGIEGGFSGSDANGIGLHQSSTKTTLGTRDTVSAANTNKDSDLVTGVFLGQPKETNCAPSSSEKWVVFNGNDGSIYDSHGVDRVVRISTGVYQVYWIDEYEAANYAVAGAVNMWNSGGAGFGLGSNALSSKFVEVEIRGRTNTNLDAALVSVIAVGPRSTPRKHEKYVCFNGKGTATIINSLGVKTVSRISAGTYKITWTTPFPDNNYVMMGASNVDGNSGTILGLEGHNIAGTTYYNYEAGSAYVGARVLHTNANTDSDLICIIAMYNE